MGEDATGYRHGMLELGSRVVFGTSISVRVGVEEDRVEEEEQEEQGAGERNDECLDRE